VRPACDLIEGLCAQNVLADMAYDADRLYRKIIDQGGDSVVPPRAIGCVGVDGLSSQRLDDASASGQMRGETSEQTYTHRYGPCTPRSRWTP
jgi:hypothetical protein